MVVYIQPFLLFSAIFLHKRHNMTLKIVFNSNILNNKGIQTPFSVQILSTFTFSTLKQPLYFTLSHCFWDVKITFFLNVILVGRKGISNVVEKVVCVQPFCGFWLVVVSEINVGNNCFSAFVWVPLQGAWSSGA